MTSSYMRFHVIVCKRNDLSKKNNLCYRPTNCTRTGVNIRPSYGQNCYALFNRLMPTAVIWVQL